MKKNLRFLLIIPTLAFLLACSGDKQSDGLTFSDFEKRLKSTMLYEEIVDTFGQPSEDIGSGIHIYVYQLSDNTEMWIGYTIKIMYARQMDSSHQQLRILI